MIEKLQLDNALSFLDHELEKQTNASQPDPARIAALQTQRSRLLAWTRWMELNTTKPDLHPIPPQPFYPASQSLKHLWLSYAYEKTHIPYNITLHYPISAFDSEVFKETVSTILMRHELLRTIPRYSDDYAAADQHILPGIDPGMLIQQIDLHNHPDKDAAIQVHINEAKRHVFNFEQGPPLQFIVLRLAEQQHLVIFNIAHAIFDGFSKELFEKEFITIYQACSQRQPYRLPPLTIQYKDFCHWEQQLDTPAIREAYKAWWFANNKTAFPIQNLTTKASGLTLTDLDYQDSLHKEILPYIKETQQKNIPRLYGVTAKPGRTPANTYWVALDNDTFIKCNNFCRRKNTTLYPLFVAALNTLLYQRTGIPDLVIGAHMALRDQVPLQKIIGLLVNTVLIRTQINPEDSFNDLLNDAMINTSIASCFKYYPLAKVLKDMNIPFNAIDTLYLNMLPTPSGETLKNFSRRHYYNNTLSYFRLDIHVQRFVNGIELMCVYDLTLYNEQTITELIDEFIALLRSVIHNPGDRILSL